MQHGSSTRAPVRHLSEMTESFKSRAGGDPAARLQQMTQLKEMHLKSLTPTELLTLSLKPNTFLMPEATRHPHRVVFEGSRAVNDQLAALGVTGRVQMLVAPFINVAAHVANEA